MIELFANKIDQETKLLLFKERHWKKAKSVLASIKRGDYSDPAGSVSFFYWKTTPDGRFKVDRDGLPIFGCYRGTNKTEAMHRALAMAFGHLFSGPRYSNNLLAEVRHRYNWRMSEKYRQESPDVGHYDGQKIDTINSLYMALFACLK